MDPKQVNVLKLPKRPGYVEAPIEYARAQVATLSDIDTNENEIVADQAAGNLTRAGRRKRNSGLVILPEAITDNEGKTRHVVTMVTGRLLRICFPIN